MAVLLESSTLNMRGANCGMVSVSVGGLVGVMSSPPDEMAKVGLSMMETATVPVWRRTWVAPFWNTACFVPAGMVKRNRAAAGRELHRRIVGVHV